jgi:hypothetical protein
LAFRVSRSIQHTVRCRLLQIRALTQLGFLEGASRQLLSLLSGTGLPDPTTGWELVIRDENGQTLGGTGQPQTTSPLRSDLLPGHPLNQPTISIIAQKPLPQALDVLYGTWAVAHINLARACFLMRLGSVPNLWRSNSGSLLKKTPQHVLGENRPMGIFKFESRTHSLI